MPNELQNVTKVGENAGADYWRVGNTSIRVSTLHPVGPLCLTCLGFDCQHIDAFLAYQEQEQQHHQTHAA
jgi:hypothetical protein